MIAMMMIMIMFTLWIQLSVEGEGVQQGLFVSENQIQKCNFSSYLDKYTDQMDLPKQVE
jgi:hypothetical protein